MEDQLKAAGLRKEDYQLIGKNEALISEVFQENLHYHASDLMLQGLDVIILTNEKKIKVRKAKNRLGRMSFE